MIMIPRCQEVAFDLHRLGFKIFRLGMITAKAEEVVGNNANVRPDDD